MSTTNLMVDNAGRQIVYELHLFARTIAEQSRTEFFHPCNRDEWVRAFCDWLAAKQQKSAEIRASND